jgi:exo-poly-alpha-galacturonosidase
MQQKKLLVATLPIMLLWSIFCVPSAQASPKTYNIADYGAIADGKTINTIAIQSLIDQCSARGGGVIIVPAGTFLTGAIFLKQGVNLRIEKNGVLKGSVKQSDFPPTKTRWEGVDRVWTAAMINAVNLKDVEISGEGTIDGSGTEWPKIIRRRTPWNQLTQAQRDSIQKIPYVGRPRLICFQNCTKVKIANVKLLNQAVWCMHILYCKNVEVQNINIRAAHTILSSDGIDIDSSNGVHITGCDIDVNDDCISIKSGKDTSGLRVNIPSENILIEKTRFGFGHGGVAMGSETSGGIRKVEVRNCIVDSANWAPIRFKTQPSRGGIVEDIVYRNIQIISARQAFEFNMEWRMMLPIAPPARVLPIVRNIQFINVSGVVNTLGSIQGLKDSPITNITFKNCNITAQKGLSVDNAKQIDYSGLLANVKEGQKIISKPVHPEQRID